MSCSDRCVDGRPFFLIVIAPGNRVARMLPIQRDDGSEFSHQRLKRHTARCGATGISNWILGNFGWSRVVAVAYNEGRERVAHRCRFRQIGLPSELDHVSQTSKIHRRKRDAPRVGTASDTTHTCRPGHGSRALLGAVGAVRSICCSRSTVHGVRRERNRHYLSRASALHGHVIKPQSPCADFGKLLKPRIESSNRWSLESAVSGMYRRLRPRLPCVTARCGCQAHGQIGMFCADDASGGLARKMVYQETVHGWAGPTRHADVRTPMLFFLGPSSTRVPLFDPNSRIRSALWNPDLSPRCAVYVPSPCR